MKPAFAAMAAFVAFAATGAMVESSAPWLSSAQVLTMASLMGLLWFTVLMAGPDFLAESDPSKAIHRGRATLMTVQQQAAPATISLLWGAIRVEIPMPPQPQTAWAAA